MVRVCLQGISWSFRRTFYSNALFLNDKLALTDKNRPYSYKEVAHKSAIIAQAIKNISPASDVEKRVCFVTPNSSDYVFALFGTWFAGHVAIPLCKSHPQKILNYYINDSKSDLVITSREYADKVHPICEGKEMLVIEDLLRDSFNAGNQQNPSLGVKPDKNAMIIYTSGTTGPPKGVVLTHGNLKFQTETMTKAWEWTANDTILHCLPLHHVHGIVNCLLTPLSVGASIVLEPEFNPMDIWRHWLKSSGHKFRNLNLNEQEEENNNINVFMAVPTIYSKLIMSWDKLFGNHGERETVKTILRNNLRLMVSGSAALPQPVLEKWREISGHTLLERYGMTEIGMALTNPLRPETSRTPGCVGKPFHGVEARIVSKNEKGEPEILAFSNVDRCKITEDGKLAVSGELQIKSPGVFKEYFNKPDETEKEFEKDGWFKTGDSAAVDKNGIFKILGRSSVDIIKSGGYKISALDVERTLLTHPVIQDVAVLGIDDPEYGQKIVAVVVHKPETKTLLTLRKLQNWSKGNMPNYYVPRDLKILSEMPRNNMGKINKKELIKTFF